MVARWVEAKGLIGMEMLVAQIVMNPYLKRQVGLDSNIDKVGHQQIGSCIG